MRDSGVPARRCGGAVPVPSAPTGNVERRRRVRTMALVLISSEGSGRDSHPEKSPAPTAAARLEYQECSIAGVGWRWGLRQQTAQEFQSSLAKEAAARTPTATKSARPPTSAPK